MSGIESGSGKSSDYTFTESDVESVKNICARGNHKFHGVDILISSSWPKDITVGQKCQVCAFFLTLCCIIFSYTVNVYIYIYISFFFLSLSDQVISYRIMNITKQEVNAIRL